MNLKKEELNFCLCHGIAKKPQKTKKTTKTTTSFIDQWLFEYQLKIQWKDLKLSKRCLSQIH